MQASVQMINEIQSTTLLQTNSLSHLSADFEALRNSIRIGLARSIETERLPAGNVQPKGLAGKEADSTGPTVQYLSIVKKIPFWPLFYPFEQPVHNIPQISSAAKHLIVWDLLVGDDGIADISIKVNLNEGVRAPIVAVLSGPGKPAAGIAVDVPSFSKVRAFDIACSNIKARVVALSKFGRLQGR